MSAEVTSQVFNRYPASGGEFTLALALADYAWADGTNIFPGVETLAQKSRQSVRAVQMHLRAMLASGWLQVVNDARGGRGKRTHYRINPQWLKGADIAPLSARGASDLGVRRLPAAGPESAEGEPSGHAADGSGRENVKGADIAPFTQPGETTKGAKRGTERVQNDALKGAKQSTPYITVLTVIEETPLPPEGGAPGFDHFAAGYPRQVDMDKARRAWDKLAPNEQLQGEIAQAIQAWIRSPEWQRENGRFIPKPGNWLRNRRWRDVPGIAVKPPAVVAEPLPAVPVLTEEQLARNRDRAAEAVAHARRVLGKHAVAA